MVNVNRESETFISLSLHLHLTTAR